MASALRKIKSTLKRIKDPVIRERLFMVKEGYQKPLRDVAEKFCCTHGKVAYWKNRYKEYGLNGLKTKQRSGRPSKISKDLALKIKRKVRKHNIKRGWRTKHVKEVIYKEAGVLYSSRQIIRISQSWGLSQVKPRPRYTYSKKDDREEFIKKTEAS